MRALCYRVNQGRRNRQTLKLAYNEIHNFGLHNIGPAAAGPAGPVPAPLPTGRLVTIEAFLGPRPKMGLTNQRPCR